MTKIIVRNPSCYLACMLPDKPAGPGSGLGRRGFGQYTNSHRADHPESLRPNGLIRIGLQEFVAAQRPGENQVREGILTAVAMSQRQEALGICEPDTPFINHPTG